MQFIFYYVFLRWFFNIILRAQQDPIESLYISVEAELSKLLEGAEEGAQKLTELGQEGDKTGDKITKGVGKSKSAFNLMVSVVQKLLTIVLDLASALSKAFDTDAPKDFQDQIVNLKKQIQEVVDDLKDTGDAADNAGKKGGKSAAALGFAFGLAAGAAQKLLDIALKLVVAIPQMLAQLGQEAIRINALFETLGVQFETLLGSMGAAQGRLEDIRAFAVETPFELPEIIEANRQLQLFGGSVLATNDNMRLMGDAVAGVSGNIQEIAIWWGRLYSQIQGGKPFGEAAQRLQELGILSPEIRSELERMQKEGEDGAKIWAFFAEQIGDKFGGNMARLAKTFTGITSNIADFRTNLILAAGEPFFEEIKNAAQAFLDLLNENEDVIYEVATGIGELAASVIRLGREGLEGLNIRGFLEGLGAFVERLSNGAKATGAFLIMLGRFTKALLGPSVAALGAVLGFVERLILAIPILGDVIQFLRGMWSRLDEALITAAQLLAFAEAGAKGLAASLMPLVELVKLLGEALIALVSGDFATASQKANQALQRIEDGLIDLDAGAQAAADSFLESAEMINGLIAPIEDVEDAIDDAGDAAKDMADSIEDGSDAIAGMLDSLTTQMIDAVERRNEQLANLERDHAEKVRDILADANKKRLDIEEKYSDDLEKLAKDTEEKRLEIIADTREQLAKLASDTDKELARRRSEFNRDELRETEDHLREMRRLEEDFLLNLEDAVRERDARAIVDLERRFQLESQRKEEDFQTDQSRGQADFSAELAQIRDNEAERRQEILDAQAKALEDLRIHEEEKRLELEQRRVEDLEKLQENLNERLMKEQQNYLDRQASLQQALQKQLEAIAQNLADEKDVTEEGAREILEIFNKYFGIGGDIDKLMEQFATRRRIRADIQVEFSGPTSAPITGGPSSAGMSGPTTGLVPVPTFQHGGSMVATKPTLAMFGEAGPELATFTPLSQLSSVGDKPQKLEIEFSGSAPPGIGPGERDMIASTLLSALRDAGALAEA